MFALLGTGCVSIDTYESRIKRCRDQEARAEQMEKENRFLSRAVQELELETRALKEDLQGLTTGWSVLSGTATDIAALHAALSQEFKDDVSTETLRLTRADGELAIALEKKVLFDFGSLRLREEGRRILDRVARHLRDVKGYYVRVDGHTDDTVISPELRDKFPTNWDMAAARASAVLRYLQDPGGVDPALLVLTAFAQYRPVADNATPEGREQNRRIEITLTKPKTLLP